MLFKTFSRNLQNLVRPNCHTYYIFYSHAGTDLANQVGIGHYYHIFYEGCLTNFDIGDDGEEEASLLYPEVQYTGMEEYMKRYL